MPPCEGGYKNFKIGELFDVDRTWIYGKNKQYKTRLSQAVPESIAVISGTTVNNGIVYYTNDRLSKDELFKDCLTISTRGEYSGTVTYHDGYFCLANNILVISTPNWSKESKLYLATLISKLNYGGYSGYPRKETLKEDIITLPTTATGAIDFAFMESRIRELEEERMRELEEERMRELEAYLAAAGFANCDLTPQEQGALRKFNDQQVNFKQYTIGDLFEIATGRDIIIGKTQSGDIPLISHQHSNNGISQYIQSIPDRRIFSHKDTIPLADRGVFLATTQCKDFHIGTRVKAMKFKQGEQSENIRLFFVTSINQLQTLFTDYLTNATDSLPSLCISLPTTPDGEIDYPFMETYISAIKKQTIAALKDFIAREHRAYTQVITE